MREASAWGYLNLMRRSRAEQASLVTIQHDISRPLLRGVQANSTPPCLLSPPHPLCPAASFAPLTTRHPCAAPWGPTLLVLRKPPHPPPRDHPSAPNPVQVTFEPPFEPLALPFHLHDIRHARRVMVASDQSTITRAHVACCCCCCILTLLIAQSLSWADTHGKLRNRMPGRPVVYT